MHALAVIEQVEVGEQLTGGGVGWQGEATHLPSPLDGPGHAVVVGMTWILICFSSLPVSIIGCHLRSIRSLHDSLTIPPGDVVVAEAPLALQLSVDGHLESLQNLLVTGRKGWLHWQDS
jgi:hypothetical protein